MKAYNFMISAVICDQNGHDTNGMVIYDVTTETRPHWLIYGPKNAILYNCKKLMSCVEWQVDDGEDSHETDYCQYVAYPEKGKSYSYLLATFEEVETE